MDFDINLLRNLVTVTLFVAFLAIVWWTYAPSRKQRLEDIGKAILEKADQ